MMWGIIFVTLVVGKTFLSPFVFFFLSLSFVFVFVFFFLLKFGLGS